MTAQKMPPPLPGHKQRRFPGLRVRPAQSYDFPLMARMANEIFQHERDIDYFDRHRSVKMGYEDEAMVADRLLAAETDWRLADMRRNRHNPGRHFFVATYFKQPAAYMTSLHDGQPREEILGWAEWQDPGRMAAAEPGLSDSLSDSDHSEQNAGEWQGKVGGALGQLASILKEIRLVHGNQELLVPPNGLAVSLPDTLGSFDEAAANRPDDWKRWSEELLPNCLGKHGDVHGRHLVLRSLVISTARWDDGIDRRLLKWGMLRANHYGWDIQTIASSVSASTADTFREVGFVELGRLDILRDTQIALGWNHFRGRDPRKRTAVVCDDPVASKSLTKRSRLVGAEVSEE